MNARVDLVGLRFGRLTVVAYDGSNRFGQAHWLARCDCGGETITAGCNLRSGNTQSCGCLRKRTMRERYAARAA